MGVALREGSMRFLFPGRSRTCVKLVQWLKRDIGPKCTPVAWCCFAPVKRHWRRVGRSPRRLASVCRGQDRGREIDGDHGNILNEPQVKQLAEEIRSRLEKAQAELSNEAVPSLSSS